MKGCRCGHPRKRRLTLREIDLYSKLRGYRIPICVLCGHEVDPITRAHDVRKLACGQTQLAHKACVKASCPESLTPRPVKASREAQNLVEGMLTLGRKERP